MAIKISGTDVINNNRVLTNIADVDAGTVTALNNAGVGGTSTAVNGVGTYTLAYDTGMADASTDSQAQWKVYKEGRTAAGSALRGRAAVASPHNGANKQATSTSGTNVSAETNGDGGRKVATVTSNQTYSGSWRLMSPGANKSDRSSNVAWAQVYTALWVRYS